MKEEIHNGELQVCSQKWADWSVSGVVFKEPKQCENAYSTAANNISSEQRRTVTVMKNE